MWAKLIEQNFLNNILYFQYYSGIKVWIERPHIVNRKLTATEIIETYTFSCVKNVFYGVHSDYVNFDVLKSNFSKEFEAYLNSEITSIASNCNIANIYQDEHADFFMKFRKLIPRNLDKFSDVLEAIILDKKENSVTFWPNEMDVLHSAITPSFPYRFKLCDNMLIMETYRNGFYVNSTELASEEWLKCTVFPKVFKWCCNSPAVTVLPSLKLISVKNYSLNYHYLKGKHAKKYVQIWPEVSDPLKYVYEDLAIAAYLMTLWEKERNDLNLPSKQTFVDLGCGNGLLVDILTSEGERTIEPSDYHIFPNYDWIIGNHSDELTPWIPIIAARSSYKMKVFLLPCCPFTFNGKYKRCHPGNTQYQSYLSFIQHVCESVGFKVEVDKLRIPSTKRICFVCSSRTYQEEEEGNIDKNRTEFINKHSNNNEKKATTSCENSKSVDCMVDDLGKYKTDVAQKENWISNFKPREKVEVVQNCTNLDKKFLEDSVKKIANILLSTDNYIPLHKGSKTILWNSGGKEKLGDLIKLVDPFILKNMKNQCGGFQTFLRNHRNVFTIKDGDVQLTVPSKDHTVLCQPVGKRKRHKKGIYSFCKKPCYFFFHHPQGCPLEANDCNFFHESTEKFISKVNILN